MSNANDEIGSDEAAPSNTDRLLQHLKTETLAAQFVQAHRDATDPIAALKKILMERLEQVRQILASAKN
jgi:hypothetical protein